MKCSPPAEFKTLRRTTEPHWRNIPALLLCLHQTPYKETLKQLCSTAVSMQNLIYTQWLTGNVEYIYYQHLAGSVWIYVGCLYCWWFIFCHHLMINCYHRTTQETFLDCLLHLNQTTVTKTFSFYKEHSSWDIDKWWTENLFLIDFLWLLV